VLAVAGGSFAFAASNNVASSNVGVGNSVISGYTVENIQYTYATNDPTNVARIDFTLDKPATAVKIQLDSTAVSGDINWGWMDCTPTLQDSPATGTDVSCVGSSGNIATTAIKNLNVYASDDLLQYAP
jgi:hypothetical protein